MVYETFLRLLYDCEVSAPKLFSEKKENLNDFWFIKGNFKIIKNRNYSNKFIFNCISEIVENIPFKW